jgi:aspartyl-tRNA synthetase
MKKYFTHKCGKLSKKEVEKMVKLIGWVDTIRYHGKVVFLNLRDRYGIVQVIVRDEILFPIVKEIAPEWVITVKGKVLARPKEMVNPNIPTGEIEVEAISIEVVSKSKVPPFVIKSGTQVTDELRLKYRFLDLRRPFMQEGIIFRSKLCYTMREYLHKLDFVEIETPILGKSTPEGARDFLVPSRLHPGKFYSLTQSPQIYKQLLMVAGFEKYYQFARCLRDEDQRSDRQLEHTQLDIEMSFVEEEDIFEVIEGLMKYTFEKLLKVKVKTPFKKLTYKESIEKYGTDKPDTRYKLEIKTIRKMKNCEFRKFVNKVVKYIEIEKLLSRKEIEKALIIGRNYGVEIFWLRYDGKNFSSPIVKYLGEKFLAEIKGNTPRTIFLTSYEGERSYEALGGLRNYLINTFFPSSSQYNFLWVTDFPIFEYELETKKLVPKHHIFVMPKEEKELKNRPVEMKGKLYDLVLNGVELGSGSIRVHNKEIQKKLMKIVGMSEEEINNSFSTLLTALEYGAPPHGGIALGMDRLTALMINRKGIQEVIAFPKTLKGVGLVEGIPSEVTAQQLKELHIKIVKKRES